MRNIIFLGAGASRSDGAPLQNELFKEYFKIAEENSQNEDVLGIRKLSNNMDYQIELQIKKFFKEFFNITDDVDSYPTFEEALGILDLSISRNEPFYIKDRTYNLNSLDKDYHHKERLALVLSMAETISFKLKKSPRQNNHYQLIKRLNMLDLLKNTTFVSTNYDILIDNAILEFGHSIDYGFNRYHSAANKTVQLLKIHGSLNWLYCPVCKEFLATNEKLALNLVHDLNRATCKNCRSLCEAIIIPPTFFKDYSNIYLMNVWHRVEKQIELADNIVFCGYSFPDSDIYVKYLIKRGEMSGNKFKKIYIVNNYNGKAEHICQEEYLRFNRFFTASSDIEYTEMSFEDFVKAPEQLLQKQK